MKILLIEDPGHGWAPVPVAKLIELGIAHKVSGYSYLDRLGGFAYLEEDCDLGLYVQALEAKGESIEWTVHHDDSDECFVRKLNRYSLKPEQITASKANEVKQ